MLQFQSPRYNVDTISDCLATIKNLATCVDSCAFLCESAENRLVIRDTTHRMWAGSTWFLAHQAQKLTCKVGFHDGTYEVVDTLNADDQALSI